MFDAGSGSEMERALAVVVAAAGGDAPVLSVGSLSAAELAGLVRAGEVVRGRVEALLAPVVAALGADAAVVLAGSGVARREVRRRRRVAAGLVSRPEVAAALASGVIGSGHAEVLAGHGAVLSDAVLGVLLAEAPSMTVDAFARTVARAVLAATPDDGLGALHRRRNRRRCTTHVSDDAMGVVRVESDDVVHAELVAILDDAVDVLWREDHPDRSPSLADRVSFPQRRHDAVVAIFRAWRDGTGHGHHARGRRPRVVAIVDAAALYDGLDAAGVATLVDATPIPVGEARRLAAEHGVIPMVLGGRSEILDVGRARRDATDAQRVALAVRQHGRCAIEHCDRPIHHAHHVHHWRDGGPTDLDNLQGLCGTHHRQVHERDPDQRRIGAAGRPPP